MLQLTEKYWSKFNKDGVLFEKLCQKLLSEVINKDIKKTKQTRDHGHDLDGKVPILNDNYMIIWGECKYHSKKLSLQKISSTLVMAYLNDVDFLYFFSYSPVTEEFEYHIVDFCEKAKIHHKVYDDIKLETLLLDYSGSKWFPDFFPDFKLSENIVGTGGLKITSFLKKYNTDGLDDSDKEYTVNEAFQYRIYIKNEDIHNKYDVNVCLLKDESLKYVEIVSMKSPNKYTKKVSVSPCSTVTIVYKLRIINYSPNLKLPEIVIRYDDEQISIKKKISVNWLAEVPLLGSKYSDYLNKLQKNIINLKIGSIIHIFGRSGCGKSRLINETLNIFDKNLYNVISFDSEHQNLNIEKIVRKTVSTLERLPDYIDDAENITNDIKFKEYHLKMAYLILYSKDYDINKNLPEIYKYLEFLLNKQKAIITFDNLQNCSKDVIEFCQYLMSLIFKQNSKSVILGCINMDQVLEGSSVEKFHNTLLLWAAKNPNYCVIEECVDFDENMARLYLKKTISPQIKSDEYLYEKTFLKIIKTIGTNPFILQQTLLLLEQKQIISLSPKGTFFFKDIENLNEILNKLSPKVMSVLKLREDAFLTSLLPNEVEIYKQIIAILIFFKTVPNTLFFEVFDKINIVKAMRKSGIINDLQDKDISFYHNYFYLYYRQNLEYRQKLKELYSLILSKLDELLLKRNFYDAYFILNYRNSSLTSNLILEGVDYIIQNNPKEQFFDEYCEIIFLLITEEKINTDFETKLILYKRLCLKVSENRGVQQGNLYYDAIVTILPDEYNNYINEPERYFNIIKSYADNLNQLYASEETLNIIEKAEEIIPIFQMEKNIEAKILSKLYNRKSIPLKDQGNRDAAIFYIQRALNLSLEIRDYALCIDNCHDYGYMYYTDRENKDLLTKYWNMAFSIYQKHLQDSTNEKIIVTSYAHSIISDLVQFSFRDAKKKIKVLENHMNKTQMPYYENKIRLVKSLYYLIAEDYCEKNQKAILQSLKEAQDYCVVHNYNRDYYKCFYLEAVYEHKNFRYLEAYDNYCIALECLVGNFKGNPFPQKYYPQIVDIIIQLRRLQGKKECLKIVKGLTDSFIKDTVKKYLSMSEEKFLTFYDSYIPNTPIIDKEQRLGYPSI